MAQAALGFLSKDIRAQKKYYIEIQKREANIRLLFDLVSKKIELDDEKCNIFRRTDRLFKTCYEDFDSLFIFEKILFRCRFVDKGQKMRIGVVMNQSDAERQIRRFHNTLHRGAMLDYSMMSRKIWTPDLLSVCQSVQRSCRHCSSFYVNKRALKGPLHEIEGCFGPNVAYCDLCGPISGSGAPGNNGKAYVMVILNPTTYYQTFIFLPNKSAKVVNDRFFNEYLKYFPGLEKLVIDRGGGGSIFWNRS